MTKGERVTWKLHVPGVDPQLDEIIARRFGPGWPRPCKRPEIIECALWICQVQNECAHVLTDDEKYEAALNRQKKKARP